MNQSFADEHEAFAASRVSQYVFVPTKEEVFTVLDQHADTLDGDVKPPLVLVGNEGSGKSALLANWVAKRREHKHRDEFLFQHFVGCSSQSFQLAHTLFRLETALKDFFQLREMKVPDTEVELRWSLNRFLEAASKKHSPARIVIIIDGISKLKTEGAPDGSLHWLPTELPPCVRFIVSTVEVERKGSTHRTFVELARRHCPILRIDPLGVTIRHSVINAFTKMYAGSLELSENQQFKIVTAQSSSQPLFLRALLQALRLTTELTDLSVDELLEKFLACSSAHELIERNLNVCCQFMTLEDNSFEESGENSISDLLGKIMSVVYASRSGLTEAEIWGLLRMVSKIEPDAEQSAKLLSILKNFTMVVNNMHTFSHEIYHEVVYQKYICSRPALVRWHNVLARFFGQLSPCDRKLVALPYHLEMAGSWAKVKNCLTDIKMFQLWWTPKFKTDFIKFWASLTQLSTRSTGHNNKETNKRSSASLSSRGRNGRTATANGTNNGNTNGGDSVDHDANALNRPTYDIVEEYVKSLDEYRNQEHPSDEAVAGIILEIGDFLLEFATLGHEENADVPASIHPKVLPEDLRSIGVPYVDEDNGHSVLCYPYILHSYSNKQKMEEMGSGGDKEDGPGKAIDELPLCTTYYFQRWMWIQFPFVALGNCNTRYINGILHVVQLKKSDPDNLLRGVKAFPEKKLVRTVQEIMGMEPDPYSDEEKEKSAVMHKNKSTARDMLNFGTTSGSNSVNGGEGKELLSRSMNAASLKLPQIKFNRKAARSIPRINKHLEDEAAEAANKVQMRLLALQDNIQNYREEYDFVVQKKALVANRLQELKDSLTDLQRTALSANENDDALAMAIKREAEGAAKLEKVLLVHRNLQDLHVLCLRHPANVPALITELHTKVEEDAFLIAEIKKRLWEQRFEKQAHLLSYKHMKSLVSEAVAMQDKLLEFRYKVGSQLAQQAEDERAVTSDLDGRKTQLGYTPKSKSNRIRKQLTEKEFENEAIVPDKTKAWEEMWNVISARTGIIEPESFFDRINNSTALVDQIRTIKKTSEARLEMMKKEVITVEGELEEVRYTASLAGVTTNKEYKKQLGEKQQKLRQVKEKTEAIEQLQQRVVAGLAHISDILFIPKSEDDAPVSDLHKNIEAVLDTLINEREKQLQQQQQGQAQQAGVDSQSKMANTRDSGSVIPEAYTNRSPELDFVIAKHEAPTVRLPARLPSKPTGGLDRSVDTPIAEGEEPTDDGILDRLQVKTLSINVAKKAQKARENEGKQPQITN
eukprot:gene11606-13487_t